MSLPDEYYEIKNEFGYGLLKKGTESEELEGIVFLETLYINKENQCNGHGGLLLEELLDSAFEFDYKKVIVHARPLVDDANQQALIDFYKKHDFTKSTVYSALLGVYMEINL